MNIPVLLEPTPAGFRASTGAPLNLTAEAPTADAALAAIRGAWQAREAAGATIVEVNVPSQSRFRQLIAEMAAHPDILDQVDAATKEYRREREAEEDAAEAAAEAARKASSPAAARQEPAA
jgi:hypothetical protein